MVYKKEGIEKWYGLVDRSRVMICSFYWSSFFLETVFLCGSSLGEVEFDGHLVREQDHECRVGLPLSTNLEMHAD